MKLNKQQKTLIERRTNLVRIWPIAGGISLALSFGLLLWLVFAHPLLANPFYVMARIEEGSVPVTTLHLMAGILPIMTLIANGLLIAIVVFAWISIRREAKYLEMIKGDQ